MKIRFAPGRKPTLFQPVLFCGKGCVERVGWCDLISPEINEHLPSQMLAIEWGLLLFKTLRDSGGGACSNVARHFCEIVSTKKKCY